MGLNDLEEAIESIEREEIGDFHGPKPESLIARAEQALWLKFPPSYRQFLARFGCGGIPGCELYGLVDDDFENSSTPDAVWLTLDERESSQLPDTLILISDTGDGGFYAIDVSRKTKNDENPIVEWWPGAAADAAGQRNIVAEDFGAFLLQQVEQARDE